MENGEPKALHQAERTVSRTGTSLGSAHGGPVPESLGNSSWDHQHPFCSYSLKCPEVLEFTAVLIQALITTDMTVNHAVGREKTNSELSQQSLSRKENVLRIHYFIAQGLRSTAQKYYWYILF